VLHDFNSRHIDPGDQIKENDLGGHVALMGKKRNYTGFLIRKRE
jgi:hypothetical protein